jgi:hypothetical protein
MLHLALFSAALAIAQATSAQIHMGDYACSGTVIGSTASVAKVLTAKHCAALAVSSIDFRDGEIGTPIRGYVAKYSDVAIILVNVRHPHYAAAFATRAAQTGEDVLLFGLSQDIPWTLARGFIMGADHVITYDQKYRNDVMAGQTIMETPFGCVGCDEGDSGSGVFNMEGRLVGVFAAMSPDNVRSFMVTWNDMTQFVSNVK